MSFIKIVKMSKRSVKENRLISILTNPSLRRDVNEEICKANQFHPIGPTIEKQNFSCEGQIIFNSSINAEMV